MSTIPPPPHRLEPVAHRSAGFTLLELLIVIGIIALLVGILIPVVSRVRVAGQSADTASLLRALDNACKSYYQDTQSYPGMLPENMLGPDNTPMAEGNPIAVESSNTSAGFDTTSMTALADVTGTENLVLALLGGLVRNGAGDIIYDPAAVGRGPVALRAGQGKGYSAFIDIGDSSLSWNEGANGRTGRFNTVVGPAGDSIVPEFIDRYSNPLPFLYLRANTRVGVNAPVAGFLNDGTAVYYLDQVIGYTGEQPDGYYIGEGREPTGNFHENNGTFHGLQVGVDSDDTNGYPMFVDDNGTPADTTDDTVYDGPFDAIPYLMDPNTGSGARQADSYILISAGPDRVYGTRDDITSFGTVGGS